MNVALSVHDHSTIYVALSETTILEHVLSLVGGRDPSLIINSFCSSFYRHEEAMDPIKLLMMLYKLLASL